MSVDLRQCKPGDKLLTKNGTIIEYVVRLQYGNPSYPHLLQYQCGTYGKRTDDGKVFASSESVAEGDIVEILK